MTLNPILLFYRQKLLLPYVRIRTEKIAILALTPTLHLTQILTQALNLTLILTQTQNLTQTLMIIQKIIKSI